jgi:prepilin-type N-terminal cleavage/methylation domain-containing protein
MKICYPKIQLPIANCQHRLSSRARAKAELPIANHVPRKHSSIGNWKLNIENGFTLIEMILAVGVAAIVLIAVNAAFFTALHLRERTQAAVDEATPVDLALATLRRDLQCVVPPKPGGILSGDFKAGTITSPGISELVAVEMFTATGALSDNAPWGEVQRVTYELKNPASRSAPGRDLVRSVTRNLLTPATPDVEDQWLMSGVESIQFGCFDGAQWLDTWDTTGATSANTNLPVAVRVQIQMAGDNGGARPEPIEILVPIDSQSRTNLTLGS